MLYQNFINWKMRILMNKQKIDLDLISSLTLDITNRVKLMMKLFPEDKSKENLLRHLAAARIHFSFFMIDILDDATNEKTDIDEDLVNKVLDQCGCKDKNNDNR